ncbi:V4R domain-containing protein [Methanopyrus sp.]
MDELIKDLEEGAEEKGELLAEIVYERADSLEELLELLEEMGMKGIEVDFVGDEEDPEEIVITVETTVTVEFYEENPEVKEEMEFTEPACEMERALFRKLAELKYGKSMEVEETKCQLTGDDVCEFRISPKEE